MLSRRNFLEAAILGTIASRVAPQDAPGGIPRRMLGRTGESVSAIGIGGFHMGRQPDAAESIRIVRTAVDAGVTFLDNCWDYNDGASESRMGQALRDGYRGRVFLMTKIDGRDRATATRQIDESLRRLQTDHLDLLQFHEIIRDTDPDRIFADDGAIHAVLEAKQAGKTRFIGFTGHKSPEIHRKMLRVAADHGFTFDAVQMPLNVMDAHYDSFEQQVLPELVAQRIGVLGMKPLGDHFIVDTKLVTARECWRYSLSLPTSVVITGCDSLPVLEAALDAVRTFRPLSDDERKALLAKTADAARGGTYEKYKTSQHFDGTAQHPEWLGPARG
jgi:aryl-alcohol dehydrogenase-like predicted oxidoreductase